MRRLLLHVKSEDALKRMVCKASEAQVLILELADDDSPEGWCLLSKTNYREEKTVIDLIVNAVCSRCSLMIIAS